MWHKCDIQTEIVEWILTFSKLKNFIVKVWVTCSCLIGNSFGIQRGEWVQEKVSIMCFRGGSPFSKSPYPREINFLKKTGPDEGLLQTNCSTFLIVFWLSNERVWLVHWGGSSMAQHMIKNMIGSCCQMVICKLGQMWDMKNVSFLSYFYPFLRIQFRFCGPRVNLRSASEVAKSIPIDFSPLAPTV